MLRHSLERLRLSPPDGGDEEPREDEGGTDELQRRRPLVHEERGEHDGEQRLQREQD
jgi:hypothetical protein